MGGNNFIFQQDPLLLGKNMSAEDTMKQLELYQKALAEQQKGSQQPQSQPTLFEDIEKELSSLSEDQKNYLLSQDEFLDCQKEVDHVTQLVLANMLRPYILQTPEAKAVIEKQLDTIKMLKKRVVKESNKQQEMFREYTEKYSNLTWNEYVEYKTQEVNELRASA